MKVGLYNLEPKLYNLALDKLRIYHQQKGDDVEDYFALRQYDKVYCSSLFTFTPKDNVPPYAICGGTGFYTKNYLDFYKRNDSQLKSPSNNESTFIKIIFPNGTNFIRGCIYRYHPPK